MERHFGLGGIVGGAAIVLMAAQAAQAQPTQVTNVQINETSSGIELILETRDGDRPQIFTVRRGNSLVADIINAQLSLPEGNGFLQNEPVAGISSVVVNQLDANSIRVTVTGENNAPAGQVSQRDNTIVLDFNPAGETAQQPAPDAPEAASPAPPQPSPTAQAPAPSPTPPESPTPVLVPNPEVTIDGVPVLQPTQTYTPPLITRAIAPPVGDIAISNVDISPTAIDLGTAERVPRLVLRDAPVRDVLSLLARAAGLNVAYIGGDVAGLQDPAADAAPAADTAPQEVRISLDIENEPVQDVFNYVLRVAGLEANRSGRTIFVSPQLPDTARNVFTRTLRLNQVAVLEALPFLIAQGAERNEIQTTTEITTIGEGPTARTVTNTTTEVELITPERGAAPLPLRGLLVVPDERTNAITLTGDPRKIEIASSLLSQIDVRRRQVAVNVKIVDVNLLATEDFNTSFSFGVGDTFFVNDGGAAVLNYGDTNPPNAATASGNLLGRPVVENPFSGAAPFFDTDSTIGVPGTLPDTVTVQPDGTIIRENAPAGRFFTPQPSISDDPLEPGISEVELATPNVITFQQEPVLDGEGNPVIGPDGNPLIRLTPQVQLGDPGSITAALPSLFQYPSRFLAQLQAQVVSGNAKILTDPTLVIQEGQTANVVLAQDVITNITVNRDVTTAGVSETLEFERQPAGLTLALAVDRIDDNGFITLEVNPTVTSPAQTFDTGEGEIVLLSRRDLQSGDIRIRDGQTLILSGIIQETDRTTVSKIPILGDIPILGALFRSTSRENTRQEVIVLLTPQVIDDSDLSNFGYRYTPSREAQQILQRQGVRVP